jgi:tripartite-type tricarboxylate transporter receptor subunit TctC
MTQLVRRLRLALIASATLLAGLLAPLSAWAQAYPSQTIKFIVPYAPGGLPDTVARVVGQKLQERIGQSVVVENRPGGSGSIAVSALSSAPADGYTFIISDGSTFSINPILFKQANYSDKDFAPVAPVALLARSPLFLSAHPKVPVATFKEFIDYVRARPGQVNYGSSGVGSVHHIAMEGVKDALKLQMTHVPYRGTGQSVPALLGGHVEVLFSAYPSLAAAVENKSVKLLANAGPTRSPQAPDAPPIADFVPGFDFAPIVAMVARAGTPPAIVQKIAGEVIAVIKQPETSKQFLAGGYEPAAGGPEELGRAIASERERAAKVIEKAGIKVE